MSLPKIDLPIYELTIPSTGKTVKVRPFLVKEEKLLLMAVASKDDQQIIDTTKQIINNCILDETELSKMTFFDIDYLFISLRAKSVGETVDVNFKCNTPTEDGGRCGFIFPVPIDIANVKVYNMDTPKSIELTPKISVKMKYPSYDVMRILSSKEDDFSKTIKLIAACVERVFDGENTYTPKDYSTEEFEAFIEGMTEQQFKKLEDFVKNLPYFVITAEEECPKCKTKHKAEYKDFTSFFR